MHPPERVPHIPFIPSIAYNYPHPVNPNGAKEPIGWVPTGEAP